MNTSNNCRNAIPVSVREAAIEIWCRSGKRHWIPIVGFSMFPFLREGDQVLVTHGYNGIRRGDVIVFKYDDILITHRVMSICGDKAAPTFITKGDNSSGFDSPLNTNEIVGQVVAIRRGVRYIPVDTNKWRILGWLIAVCTLVWIKICLWLCFFSQLFFQRQFNHLNVSLRRKIHAFPSLVQKAVQAIVCRWEDRA